MDKRGQIIAMDFLLSVMVMVLALGLMFQMIELNYYNTKEMGLQEDLARIGETAADLLVSHPDITCDVRVGPPGTLDLSDIIGEIPNCIQNGYMLGEPVPTKDTLRIPSEYNCWIGFSDGAQPTGFAFCNDTGSNSAENIYSSGRIVLVSDHDFGVKKGDIQQCMNGLCTLDKKTLIIKVWKA